MKNLITAFLGFLSVLVATGQNANSFNSVSTYKGSFAYGTNQGYYGGSWTAQNTGKAAADLGVNDLRIPLYDDFLTTWGLSAELADVKYYQSLGMKDFVAFIGSPHSSHLLDSTFPGTTSKANVFRGMYEPIWLDAQKTKINPANLYATYLYNVVSLYGPYIKFYEIINEPDFSYSPGGWLGDVDPIQKGSWFDHNPTADEMFNMHANIFFYIRYLRISWEVIKTLSPSSYVCTGGIGNRSFLDAILRNSDNPVDGSVTSDFPLKGGAYFDVISFHNYPEFQLKHWDNTLGTTVYNRHSDDAVNKGFLKIKNWMDSLAIHYGYNGVTFPKKQFICTETGVSRVMNGEDWGSDLGSLNFVIKVLIACQKNSVRQLFIYQLGDANSTAQFDQMGMYLFFGNNAPLTGLVPTKQGIGFATTSLVLAGRQYDSVKTKSLNFPSPVDGAAFKAADGSYTYVLWAKTTTDLSEANTAVYNFPGTGNLVRKEWDYFQTKKSTPITGQGISLTATPSFFEEAASTLPVKLVNFSAALSNSNVLLAWNVAEEINLQQYDIERSTDGSLFSKLSTITASGSSSYQYSDLKPLSGRSFYRLKILNKDQSFTYSPIRFIVMATKNIRVEVYNYMGQLLHKENSQDLEIIKRSLPAGFYILKIYNDQSFQVEKFVK